MTVTASIFHNDPSSFDRSSETTDFGLVASAEPAVVFASLVTFAAPALCDSCTVDLDDDGASYRVANPPKNSMYEPPPGPHSVSHRFEGPPGHAYLGIATFTWLHRSPSAAETVLTRLLVEHAVQTVTLHRLEPSAQEAVSKVRHLEVALKSSRQIGIAIGILMDRHALPQQRAFEALAFASQQANRKLRDLAVNVIETGWLDPELLGPSFDIASPGCRDSHAVARSSIGCTRRRPPRS